MRTLRTPECFCPYCNYKIDAVSDPLGANSPNAGDLGVCLKCGNFLKFGRDWRIQKLNQLELHDFRHKQPKDYERLLTYSSAAKKVQKQKAKKKDLKRRGDRND